MILSRYDQTGMTTHTIDLSRALVRKGHEVTLLVGYRKHDDPVSDRLMDSVRDIGLRVKTFLIPERKSRLRIISAISLIINVLKNGG